MHYCCCHRFHRVALAASVQDSQNVLALALERSAFYAARSATGGWCSLDGEPLNAKIIIHKTFLEEILKTTSNDENYLPSFIFLNQL